MVLTADPASVTCPGCAQAGGADGASDDGAAQPGVRVAGVAADLYAARSALSEVLWLLAQDPRMRSPCDLPGLIIASCDVLSPLVAIVARLAAADLDTVRRGRLEDAARELRDSLAQLASTGQAAT
jgi:hypothetical protein